MRLERLKICAASSGEMPVFKLKPQKNDQDGSFLLIIECGAESSSMSIKVPLFSAFSLKLGPVQEPLFLSAPGRILAPALFRISEWGCCSATPCPLLPGVCEGHTRTELSWCS